MNLQPFTHTRAKPTPTRRGWLIAQLLVLALLALTGLAHAATWQIETVYSSGDAGSHNSLALDSSGNPHISHRVGGALIYTYWSGSNWNSSIVRSVGSPGWYTSLALDSDNNPHISYWDGASDTLMYAYSDGFIWYVETVDGTGNFVGHDSSLALDSSDQPHISYWDGAINDVGNNNLKYAHWDGSSWQAETVDSTGNVGQYTSLALDSSDQPHISYYDESNKDLKYATSDGSSWTIQTVDGYQGPNPGFAGEYTSLALDSSDQPHISYLGADSYWAVRYASWNGSSWQIETVAIEEFVASNISMALDSSDNAHISYLDHINNDLKYAAWDGSSWQVEVLDSEGNVGWYSSLALDNSDQPHISYHHVDYRDLKYAVLQTDSTPPLISANLSGTLGDNGWYQGDVTVSWTVSDDKSDVSSTSGCETTTIDADTNGITLTCEATSLGGTTSDSVIVKRDAAMPTASAAVSSAPNGNGWYNSGVTVSFSGSDDLSGLASCDADIILSSDGSGQAASGVCTDLAGNSSDPASADGINIDQTAPVVTVTGVEEGATYPPNNVPTATCESQDALSGVATEASLTVTGGNGSGLGTFTATCDGASDHADNSAVSVSVTYDVADLTPPIITANISGTLGNNDWYVSDVALTWTITDEESTPFALSGCDPATFEYDADVVAFCSAASANVSTSAIVHIKRDATPPTASTSVSPDANANGWYNGDVTVSFSGSDSYSGIDGCDADIVLSSDGSGQSASGVCTDLAGNVSAPATVSGINIDKVAPVVSVTGVEDGATYILGAVPAAVCDTNDALSGMATEASLTLAGANPDGSGTITATCEGALDNAGNSDLVSIAYTIITPQEATGNLQDDIQTLEDDGVLSKGQAKGLTQLLDNAIRSLDKGKTNAACGQLVDFVAEVNVKTPDPLDAATAADLITDAEAIRVAIGCD